MVLHINRIARSEWEVLQKMLGDAIESHSFDSVFANSPIIVNLNIKFKSESDIIRWED